jgi:class 3 adenylate cyclase/predicted ATPase
MKFSDIVDQARALLQRTGKLTYRVLRREFALDDEALEDLKEQFIHAEEVAVDQDGRMLVWKGENTAAAPVSSPPQAQSPARYTPAHLAERIRAEQAAMAARGVTEGERKTITALFADLKGSTALIEGLDPEEARAIIDPALQIMMEAVHRYEGYVAQALGDGIFALFGAPIAHEDHPQRALYAALRMQEGMRRYADALRRKGYPPLLMRVGLNTGEVVVRSIRKDDLHTDYVPVGHVTNLAARMEQLAPPGAIVVSAYTHRLTDGYFAFKDLGPTPIKGVGEPLAIYEVLGVGPLRTRLQVAARRGLTRFVGRQGELAQLHQALAQAKAGHGQIVGVMGEPGLGKSRLFYEFKLRSVSGCVVLEAYAVSHGKASPYLPVIELLKSYFRIETPDDERTRREKVGGKVLMLDRSLEDTLPYLFALLGIEEQPSPLQQMDPQIRRRRTFEALKKLFLRESLNQPLVLIFEDLHWLDGETQGVLDVLSESVASARMLLLTNYRPEYRHEWGQKTYYTQLRLAPLGKAEAEELLTFLLGKDASLTALQPLILQKTEGTPFFMEEVVQTLAEEGVLVGERGQYRLEKAPPELHISPTVQGVLAARIDRLAADEKEFVQQLAIIGREFPLNLVRRVVSQPEEELYRLLASLQRKEFLYEQPAFPEVEYHFKHALTQEVAYGSVLQDRRRALHERTAQAIEALYQFTLEEHYSELAQHYRRTENAPKAVRYLQLAGQQAAQRSANTEAVTLLTEAVALVHQLPAIPEYVRQELTLQTTLGPLLIAAKGYAAPETEGAWTRAYALCQQLGEPSQLFPVLWGLLLLYLGRADYRRARAYGEQMLSLAQRLHDSSLLLWAYRGLAEVAFCLGECLAAKTYSENSMAWYDPQQRRAQTFVHSEDPAISPFYFYSQSLFVLGYPDRALQQVRQALPLARELAHANTMGSASFATAWIHIWRREHEEARAQAEAVIALATEQGLPFWLAWGTIVRGWALVMQGEEEAGIAQIRQGLAASRAGGTVESQTYMLALLAEAYGKGGQVEAGLATVAEALECVARTGERYHEAELCRLRGELTLAQPRVQGPACAGTHSQSQTSSLQEEAEAWFQRAIEVARQQSAKSWKLRAVMSLSRLWQQRGKQHEARQLLTEIYGWFTEGFDTKDLQEAKALLEELRAAA